jgi:uncharacterized protein YjaZ
MKFNILDTQASYQRLLAAADDAEREAIFRTEIVNPFAGLVQRFGRNDGVAMFKQWLMSPDHFAGEQRVWTTDLLAKLEAYDAWHKAAQALEDANKAFAPYHDQIPLDEITFGLLIADINKVPLQRGYNGNGSTPGYVMTLYGEADNYSLPRLQGATVHELHHNIRFALFPFRMDVTVAEYIIAEGLAESLAGELYGEDKVGFYVTDFDQSRFEETKQIIGKALHVSGFNEVRGYIFGDVLAEAFNMPKAGVPDFAGYALGYHIVQAYKQRTGKSVVDATFLPADQIIAESCFFDS